MSRCEMCLFVAYSRNNKGETPRDMALRFGKLECASMLRSHGKFTSGNEDQEEEGRVPEEDDREDDPSAESVERAKERMESLQSQFSSAKARFRELGGELCEDNEIELIKTDHKRCGCKGNHKRTRRQ